MADDGKILVNDFIDSGIKAELKAVTDEMQRLVKVTSELMGVIRQSTSDQKGYVTVQKETEALTKQIVAAESKLKVIDSDLAKEAERKRQAQQKASNDLKNNVAAETSAYKKLSVEYSKALQKAKDLAAEYGIQSEQAKKAATTARGLNDQLKAIDSTMGNHQRNVGNYQEAIEAANMSMGEMKRTLRELRNIPLAGKTPEEIAQVEMQIAKLTDEMGDYQARMRSSGDSAQVMIEGLQGVVAVAQGVTAGLSAMGFNTEKLDKAMVQLIGVSQALATIHELNEKQTLKVVAAVIKDTYAKAANAIAARGVAMATNGATAATRAFGVALKSIPFVAIIAAIAALVAGFVYMTKKAFEATKQEEAFKRAADDMMNTQIKVAEATAETVTSLRLYEKIANDTNLTEKERMSALEKINELTNGNVAITDLSAESLKLLREETAKYIQTIMLQAKAEAYRSVAIEKYKELEILRATVTDNMEAYKNKQKEILQLEKDGDTQMQLYIQTLQDIEKNKNSNAVSTRTLAEAEADYASLLADNDRNLAWVKNKKALEEEIAYLKAKSKQQTKTKNSTISQSSAEDELTESIKAANQSYLLQTSLLKDESDPQKQYLSLMDAEINKSNAIYDAYKKYYEQDKSYSDDELAGLQRLNAKTKGLEEQKIALEKLFETAENAPKKPEPTISGFTPRDESMPGVSGATNLIDTIGVLNDEITAFLENYGESISSVYDSIGSVISNTFEAQNDAIDEQQKKSDEYFDNKLKAYEDDADAVRQINAEKERADKKLERERKTIAIRAAKFEKAQALVSIGVNQSKAVMNIIGTMPVASWPFLIAIAAATGIAETAAVMSKPIPQYASGIESTPRTEAALVGERGSELIKYPDGSISIAHQPTVAMLPKGTEVKNAFDTEDYLRKLSFAAMLPKINKTDQNERDYSTMLKDIHRTLKRGNTVINQGMSAREQYYYKKYSV